jgi:hypothetical protein
MLKISNLLQFSKIVSVLHGFSTICLLGYLIKTLVVIFFIDCIHLWGLFEPVSDRDPHYRNSFILRYVFHLVQLRVMGFSSRRITLMIQFFSNVCANLKTTLFLRFHGLNPTCFKRVELYHFLFAFAEMRKIPRNNRNQHLSLLSQY